MFSSILEALFHFAETTPNKPCLGDPRYMYTYAETAEMVVRAASFFTEKGIQKNENVILISCQASDFYIAVNGLQLMGAVPVLVESSAKQNKVHDIAEQVSARYVVSSVSFTGIDQIRWEEILAEREPMHFDLPETSATSEILFTTGTTGKSKGVVLTHRVDIYGAENVIFSVKMQKDNFEVLPMPLNHTLSLRRYYANTYNGCTCYIIDGMMIPARFFEAFDRYHATCAAVSPSAMAFLIKVAGKKLPDYKDKIRYLEFGGSVLPEKEKHQLLGLLPNTGMFNCYGSSEACTGCQLNFNSDDNLPNCIGRECKYTEILFVDEDNQIVETDADHPARIATRGPTLMTCYYGEPELTAKTIVNGMLLSCDLGYKDSEGRIYILGRMDDVINFGGIKISPSEVEEVAEEFPGVDECALIGIDDPVKIQYPVLFVVTGDGFDDDAYRKYLRDKLDQAQQPQRIIHLPELPKTYNGKILRRELKKMV